MLRAVRLRSLPAELGRRWFSCPKYTLRFGVCQAKMSFYLTFSELPIQLESSPVKVHPNVVSPLAIAYKVTLCQPKNGQVTIRASTDNLFTVVAIHALSIPYDSLAVKSFPEKF